MLLIGATTLALRIATGQERFALLILDAFVLQLLSYKNIKILYSKDQKLSIILLI